MTEAETLLRRPKNFWINIVLTIVVLGTMVALGDKLAPAIVFMVGTCLALLINYPDVDMQRQRVDAHARAALLMASILLAAGVFTGIMQGSGMLKAMAQTAVGFVPVAMAKFMPIILGFISMPLSLLFDPTRSTSASCRSWRRSAASLGCRKCNSPRRRCSVR